MGERAIYLAVPDVRRLDHWCSVLASSFGRTAWLVGSVLERPDFRDVDVRIVLTEDELAVLPMDHRDLNLLLSEWGQRVTGLPIDCQVQSTGDARREAEAGRPRNPRGYIEPHPGSSESPSILASLDDGVEVRRGRDVPEGWEWRFSDQYNWTTVWPTNHHADRLVECRPKPPEPVMVALSVEDAESMARDAEADLITGIDDHRRRAGLACRDALERRGRDDG